MSYVGVNHDLRVVNGRTLYMPPYAGGQEGWGNLALPDVSVADTAQKYPVGTKYVEGDRIFRYVHVSGSPLPGRGAANLNTIQERAGASWDVNGVIGDTTVYINAMVNDIDLDEFAGGWLLFAGADTGHGNQIPIVSNTAATVGNPSTIVLGHGLTGTATAGVTGSTLTASLWSQVGTSLPSGYSTIVGVPITTITDGEYGWIMTWGPCLVVPTGSYGDGASERTFYFQTDGTIFGGSDLSYDHQYAGVTASLTYYDDTAQVTNFFILQLFP